MIQVPNFNQELITEYECANRLIAELSNSRKYSSKAELTGWRKVVHCTNEKLNGHKHFVGEFVERNETLDLKEGAIIIQYDSLYINAQFYAADRQIAPESRIHVELYQVKGYELVSFYQDTSRKFKSWHLQPGRELRKHTITWPAFRNDEKTSLEDLLF